MQRNTLTIVKEVWSGYSLLCALMMAMFLVNTILQGEGERVAASEHGHEPLWTSTCGL